MLWYLLTEQYLQSFQDFVYYDNVCDKSGLICVWLCLCNLTTKTWSELGKMTARKREFPSVLPGLGKFCDWHWEKLSYWASITCYSIALHYTACSNPTAEFNIFISLFAGSCPRLPVLEEFPLWAFLLYVFKLYCFPKKSLILLQWMQLRCDCLFICTFPLI